ncbi:MAG: hypothetical protein KC583_02830 [Myxococcales bacterium]|nr:hypothetical protein [Myxococcales bacterium]
MADSSGDKKTLTDADIVAEGSQPAAGGADLAGDVGRLKRLLADALKLAASLEARLGGGGDSDAGDSDSDADGAEGDSDAGDSDAGDSDAGDSDAGEGDTDADARG